MLIDPNTGFTRYFEMGRYDPEERGLVRSRPIPNVEMGDDGLPTQDSMQNLMQALSTKFGQDGVVDGAYFVGADFLSMLNYAENLQSEMAKGDQGESEPYKLLTNNCATFCEDVLESGGVDTPTTIINSPRNVIEELQSVADETYRYDPDEEE